MPHWDREEGFMLLQGLLESHMRIQWVHSWDCVLCENIAHQSCYSKDQSGTSTLKVSTCHDWDHRAPCHFLTYRDSILLFSILLFYFSSFYYVKQTAQGIQLRVLVTKKFYWPKEPFFTARYVVREIRNSHWYECHSLLSPSLFLFLSENVCSCGWLTS